MSNAAPSSPTAPPAGAPPLRVLWCDADAARGARAKRVLAGRALVEIAADAQAALDLARGAPPDLIIATAAADADPPLPAALRAEATPVMLLAANDTDAAALAARHRVADVLALPVSDYELVARVGAQLEILRLRRALAAIESESETWLGLALKASGLGVWHSEIGSGALYMDANLAAMFGLARAPARVPDDDWLARVHAEDRPRVLAELAARREDLKPLEIDFRTVLPDGSHRSLAVLGAVVRHAGETPARGMAYRSVGVARDVTERVRDAERQQLLMSELNHRVRNTLASVLALAQQTAQDAVSMPAFLASFQARVMALAAAHNLLTRGHWESVALGALAEAILAPERSAKPDLLELAGPPCELGPHKALAMTMGLHELATNARKYGSLSSAGARLSVTWSITEMDGERRLALTWLERGGPLVAPPTRTGFGTRLLRRALAIDLDGKVALDFDPLGLRCTIEFPLGERRRAENPRP